MKHILITGAKSYIGESVKDYLLNCPEEYEVQVRDTIDWAPKPADFEGFEIVFNVAGIAHVKETDDNRQLYYDVNRDLVIKIATTAKLAGVKQFINLSTMSVYGAIVGRISKNTKEAPINAYGKSKLEADEAIKGLSDGKFRVVCLRPPMVYGKGCKGNYQSLRNFALKSPVFPNLSNERSMIYIGNLCEFVKSCIDEERDGLFFPQNGEYIRTSDMVRAIAECHGKRIRLIGIFNPIIRILPMNILKKVFGTLIYEKTDVVNTFDFISSINMTEN